MCLLRKPIDIFNSMLDNLTSSNEVIWWLCEVDIWFVQNSIYIIRIDFFVW